MTQGFKGTALGGGAHVAAIGAGFGAVLQARAGGEHLIAKAVAFAEQ